jgi:RNA polymerase sigma factor (sigma-70 family)
MKERNRVRVKGAWVEVTEEVYRVIKRSRWTDIKQRERANKRREGSILSLNKLEETGFEIPDDMVNVAEQIENKMLCEQIYAAVDKLEPSERALFIAIVIKERTVRDYAVEMGVTHQAISKRLKKVIAKLRTILGWEDWLK